MDFSLSPELQELQAKVRQFIADAVIRSKEIRARRPMDRANPCVVNWSDWRGRQVC